MNKSERLILPENSLKPSLLDNPPQDAPKPILNFLKLARREGAYSRLTQKGQQRLELHFLLGMPQNDIAALQEVSKQAVSQAIERFPESLYKQMVKDNLSGSTYISFTEILARYSDCRKYLDDKVKEKI